MVRVGTGKDAVILALTLVLAVMLIGCGGDQDVSREPETLQERATSFAQELADADYHRNKKGTGEATDYQLGAQIPCYYLWEEREGGTWLEREESGIFPLFDGVELVAILSVASVDHDGSCACAAHAEVADLTDLSYYEEILSDQRPMAYVGRAGEAWLVDDRGNGRLWYRDDPPFPVSDGQQDGLSEDATTGVPQEIKAVYDQLEFSHPEEATPLTAS